MEAAYFDSKSSKYQSCCCHVKTAATFICVIHFILGFASIIVGVVRFPNHALYFIPALVILAFVFISPIYAIVSTSSGWVIPIICLTGLGIISNIVTLVAQIFYSNNSILEKPITQSLAYELLANIVGMLLGIWFFRVFYKCYGYLNDKRKAIKIQQLAMQYQMNAAMSSMYPPNYYANPYETYPQQY